eukprot:g14551.t1
MVNGELVVDGSSLEAGAGAENQNAAGAAQPAGAEESGKEQGQGGQNVASPDAESAAAPTSFLSEATKASSRTAAIDTTHWSMMTLLPSKFASARKRYCKLFTALWTQQALLKQKEKWRSLGITSEAELAGLVDIRRETCGRFDDLSIGGLKEGMKRYDDTATAEEKTYSDSALQAEANMLKAISKATTHLQDVNVLFLQEADFGFLQTKIGTEGLDKHWPGWFGPMGWTGWFVLSNNCRSIAKDRNSGGGNCATVLVRWHELKAELELKLSTADVLSTRSLGSQLKSIAFQGNAVEGTEGAAGVVLRGPGGGGEGKGQNTKTPTDVRAVQASRRKETKEAQQKKKAAAPQAQEQKKKASSSTAAAASAATTSSSFVEAGAEEADPRTADLIPAVEQLLDRVSEDSETSKTKDGARLLNGKKMPLASIRVVLTFEQESDDEKVKPAHEDIEGIKPGSSSKLGKMGTGVSAKQKEINERRDELVAAGVNCLDGYAESHEDFSPSVVMKYAMQEAQCVYGTGANKGG